jgi:protein tyrosine phosphatase
MRICLQVPEGQDNYINASPILLKSPVTGTERKYIAAQVPFFLLVIRDDVAR